MNGKSSGFLLSLVIPVEHRVKELGQLVRSLREARTRLDSASRNAMEVIIMDSTEPPLQPSDIKGNDPDWIRIETGPCNVRQKRNLGARVAQGKWVAFVDSDCIVDTQYLVAIFDVMQQDQYPAWAGRIRFEGPQNSVWKAVAASRLVAAETLTSADGFVPWAGAANLIFLRSFFMKNGGFDESLPSRLGGDDVDLGLRLQRNGKPLAVLSNAVVIHPTEPWSSSGAIIQRTWRWGRMEYHLAHRHRMSVHPAPPPFTAVFFSLCAIALPFAIIRSTAFLLVPLLWAGLSHLMFTIFDHRRPGRRGFITEMGAGALELLFQFGTAWEHIRHASLRFMIEAPVFDGDMEQRIRVEALNNWSNLLSLSIVGVLAAWIIL